MRGGKLPAPHYPTHYPSNFTEAEIHLALVFPVQTF